jgi:hypothetical protein
MPWLRLCLRDFSFLV